MAKVTYNIRCKKDGNVVVEKLSGYTFKVDNLRFGVSNERPNGSKREVWSVTELSSGYECLIGDTKKTAINKVLDNHNLIVSTGTGSGKT